MAWLSSIQPSVSSVFLSSISSDIESALTAIPPLEKKVSAIRDFPQPSSLRKLREFLGLVNFYHRFVPNCAKLLEPLNKLLSSPEKGSRHLAWDEEATTAFKEIKDALDDATLLVHPKPNAPTCIMADAPDCAVGAVLQQYIDGGWCHITYFSKKLRPAETRYSSFDRELLAIYLAIKHLRHLVEGRDFLALTDHKPLTFALSTHSHKYTSRQIRHLDFISQFTTDIRYVSGHANSVADVLSRAQVGTLHVNQPPAVDFRGHG